LIELKEHFFYDFNTFIDNARVACLDYLEIEIPEKTLNSFESGGVFNNCPVIQNTKYEKPFFI
jgi:hypothetical protein